MRAQFDQWWRAYRASPFAFVRPEEMARAAWCEGWWKGAGWAFLVASVVNVLAFIVFRVLG